jgi:hypothetical protein
MPGGKAAMPETNDGIVYSPDGSVTINAPIATASTKKEN